MNKIYKLTFTGTEQLLKPTTIKFLPDDANFMGYVANNNPYYYSEKDGQYYVVKQVNIK